MSKWCSTNLETTLLCDFRGSLELLPGVIRFRKWEEEPTDANVVAGRIRPEANSHFLAFKIISTSTSCERVSMMNMVERSIDYSICSDHGSLEIDIGSDRVCSCQQCLKKANPYRRPSRSANRLSISHLLCRPSRPTQLTSARPQQTHPTKPRSIG